MQNFTAVGVQLGERVRGITLQTGYAQGLYFVDQLSGQHTQIQEQHHGLLRNG